MAAELLQPVLLGICLCETVFFLYYMFTFELAKQSTISDTLFSTPAYAVVLTIALVARLVGGAFYLLRFKFEHQEWELTGYFGLVCAVIGWLVRDVCGVLVKKKLTIFGFGRGWLVGHKDNTNHFAGVACFCLGSFLYSIAFIRISALFERHLRRLQIYLEMFLLVSTVVLVIVFVSLWFGEEQAIHDGDSSGGYTRTAYIVEHAAYLVHLVFYGFFFSFNSPDPNKPKPARVYDGSQDYDDEIEACKPLIQMQVLPRVSTVETLGQF